MSVFCDSDVFGICCKNGYILHIFCTMAQTYTLVLGESILLFSHSLMSDSLWSYGLQNARPPCHHLLEFTQTHIHWIGNDIHLILCCLLIFLPSTFPRITVFPNESILHITWPNYWALASASALPKNIQDRFPLGLTGWISLHSKGLLRVFSNTTVQKHQFFGAQLSLWSSSHIHT